MIFTAFSDSRFDLQGRLTRCALGKGGTIPALHKREGDGCSPEGLWPIRRLFYRADRLDPAVSLLQTTPLDVDDGWCDAADDAAYNQFIRHPYPASAERLWREDHLYDLIFVLGYNDDPVRRGHGSAIFLHLARPGFSPTEGCVALEREDVLQLMRVARPGDSIAIRPA